MSTSREIPIGRGFIAVVDEEDFERLHAYKWHAYKQSPTQIYAQRGVKTGTIRMHRQVLDLRSDHDVDHKNGNCLDNRKSNLRVCSRSQNLANQRKRSGLSSAYKGVYRSRKNWRAQIHANGKNNRLGSFVSEIDAACAYDEAARKIFGEFAAVNFPEGDGERSCLVREMAS